MKRIYVRILIVIVANAIVATGQHENVNKNQTTLASSRTLHPSPFEDLASRLCPTTVLQQCSHPESCYSRQRSIRNANDHLERAVRQMSMVARVTNGIALVQSIVNGSFDSETVFSELLHMGQLKPSDIKKMDVAAFSKAFDSMKGVQIGDAAEVEKLFKLLYTIRHEVDGVGNVAEWNPDQFQKDIGSLSKFSKDLKRNVMEKINVWQNRFSEIGSYSNVDDAKTRFNNLKTETEKLVETVSKMDSTKKLGFTFANIQSATSGFSVVIKALDGIDAYFNIRNEVDAVVHADDKFATNSGNFDAVHSVAASVPKELSATLKSILSFYEDRKSEGSRKLTSTIAFPNGFKDLAFVAHDLKDDWLKKVVKTDGLKTALAPLDSLEASLRIVAGKFGSPDDRKLQRIAGTIQIIEDLPLAENSKLAANNIREFMKTYKPAMPSGKLSMDTIKAEVGNVDAALIDLDNLVAKTLDSLKTEKTKALLQKIKNQPADFTTDDAVDQAVQSLEKDAKKFAKMMGDLNAELLRIEEAVRESKDKILANLKNLGSFKSELTTFSPLFQVLQDNCESVSKMFRVVEWFRSPERDAILTDVVGVVNSVNSTDGDLDSLNKKVVKIRSSRSNEAGILAARSDLKAVSEVIGSSVEGVVTMKKLIDKPLAFDKKWIGIVGKERRKVASPLSPSTIAQLDQIGSIEQALANMDNQLKAWSQGVKDPSSTLLANHSDLFTSAAAKVTGVDIDFVALSSAVESLRDTIPGPTTSSSRKRAAVGSDELSALRSELDKLAATGLKFSSYKTHFASSVASLRALDDFFSAFAKAVLPLKMPHQFRGDDGARNANDTTGSPGFITYVTGGDSDWLLYGGIGAGSAICVVLGISIFCCWRLGKRTKELEKEVTYNKDDIDRLQKEAEKMAAEMENQKKQVVTIKPQSAMTLINSVHSIVFFHSGLKKLKTKDKELIKHALATGLTKFFNLTLRGLDSVTMIRMTEANDEEFKNETRVRGLILHVPSRVKVLNAPPGWFTTDFLHANFVAMINGLKFILSQAPQVAEKATGKISTIDKFLWMIKENSCEFVVMLCKCRETVGVVKKNECAKYFPDEKNKIVTFERSKVECLSKTVHQDGYIERELKITFQDGSIHAFTHFQHTKWKENSAPKDPKAVIAILKRVRESTNAVVVHSSAGIGRSGAFAAIELGYQLLSLPITPTFFVIVCYIRMMRCGAVQTDIQLAFIAISLIDYILDTATDQQKAELSSKVDELRTAYEKALASIEERKKCGNKPRDSFFSACKNFIAQWF